MGVRLTKYEPAGFLETASLSLSFIFVLLAPCLMGLCDRLILADFSMRELQTSMTALWLTQLFQVPMIRAVSMSQAFVGQYNGAGELKNIGPCIWQMVWISFFSMIVTWPISKPVGEFFFRNTTLQEGRTCFSWLMNANFLFLLGTALSAFYLGRGKTKKVLLASLCSHLLHVALDFPLVFGVKDWIPPLGAKGSILSAILSQAFFCGMLLVEFLSSKSHSLYATYQFKLDWSRLWGYLRIGLPRMGARFIQLGAWVVVTRLMIGKGEASAAVLAFGGSLQMFLNCFNEGISQALTTIGANLIGSKQPLMKKLFRSSCLILCLEGFFLAVPLFLFPQYIISLFCKPDLFASLNDVLHSTCYWIWLLFLMEGLNMIGFGLLSAFRDTVFQMWFALSAWALMVPIVYFEIHLGGASPDRFWLMAAGACSIAAAVYLIRLSFKIRNFSKDLSKFTQSA